MPRTQQGSVEQLPNGRWSVRYRDHEGKQVRKSGFRKEREALRFLDTKLEEVERVKRGEVVHNHVEVVTLDELAEEYLANHIAANRTIRALRDRLGYARKHFGSTKVNRITTRELIAWRKTLPAGSAWGIVKALRQVLNHAVAIGMLDESPAKGVPNPEPKRTEVCIFESIDEVRAVDAELPRYLRGIAEFAVWTGLRPEELLALERRDVDRENRVLRIGRVYSNGELREGGKTDNSVRTVPLTDAALAVLDSRPARLDTKLLFPGKRGGHLNLNTFRRRHWTPAVEAAGIERRLTPYSTRHTWISWALAAGVPILEVARLGGTSVEQISKTYGHLLPDAHDRVRSALESYAAVKAEEAL